MDGQTDGWTDGRTDKHKRSEIFFYVVFDYRWDKCRVLAIGGTYVYLIEGRTNVGGTNVGRTNVGGRKVAASKLSAIQ